MCGRFYLDESEELRPYVEGADTHPLHAKMTRILGKPLVTKGEVFPTNIVPVIAPDRAGARAVYPMVWGFSVPGLKRPVINARSESVLEKPTFRECFERRRCVVPASWYFEWEHLKKPDGSVKAGDRYAIQPAGSQVTWLAGLYRIERFRDLDYPVFTILTRPPSEDLLRIHDRMPVLLPKERIDDWIRPGGCPEDILKEAVTDCLAEKNLR